jgi:plastocyanin
MRWIVLLGLASVLPVPLASQARGARVAGRITILEKRNKPSPDLGSAVIYLEGAGPAGTPATLDITINDKVYRPRVIVAPVGSTVRFPNTDPFDHNVFSATEPNQFDLGLYGRGGSKSHTFTHPGLVRVYCNVHPRMVAYVLVTPNRYYAQPGVDGSFAIENVPAGQYRLHVWHERIAAEIVKDVTVGAAGVADLQVALDARGYKWRAHKNKDGQEYQTNAGYERY